MPVNPGLTVSVVVYNPDLGALGETLSSLRRAIERARADDVIGAVFLDLIDNGSGSGALEAVLRDSSVIEYTGARTRILRGHGNVGYGRGHNISILPSQSFFHLVLNPDVVLSESAISAAAAFMLRHPETILITPEVRGGNGDKQYLCRAYPSVFVLYLRSFAPEFLRRRFRHFMHEHELRDTIDSDKAAQVPLASGCFMFARTADLTRIRGFSPDYFLYFEDYDLSKRLGDSGDIVYVPDVKITHYGGNASRKGLKHVGMFTRSVLTFFRTHGWRIV